MRAALALAVLVIASPATAENGIPEQARWTLDVHDVGGKQSVDAVLSARRYGAGWALDLSCETTDRKTGRVVSRSRHIGTGKRSADVPWVIIGEVNGDRITMGFPAGGEPKLLSQIPGCPSGVGNLGTGD